jgi:CubicO group peptidase (beta-lactamase class C family)
VSRITLVGTALVALMAAYPTLPANPPAAQARPEQVAGRTTEPPAARDSATPELTAVDVNAWLDGYMPNALRTGDIAGAVVAVVKNGQIVTERGYGYSDVEKQLPVNPQLTLFRPGSVSKLVTWTAVMQMVEQGKIDLDADVNQYLDFKIPPRDGKPITMRNLMQHTAGFEEQAKDIISDSSNAPSFETLLKRWVPERVFAPGTTPAYSNYGASLAAYIVERVSGEPFDDYVEKHIFQVLDMPHSTFRQPLPADLAPLMSKGYDVASSPPKPFEIIGPAPAGALSSSGEDMAHFMIAHLNNGEYHGNRILRAETAQLMHDSPLSILPPLNRMELGFFETNINGREVIAHLGDTQDFHTSLHLFLSDNVGFYVSFNSLGKNGAAGELRTALFDDFADRYMPGPADERRVDEKTAAAHAAMLVGTWVASRGAQSTFLSVLGLVGQIKVALDAKGKLVVPIPGPNGKPRDWVETAPFLWVAKEGHERLAAKVENGRIVRFSIDFMSPFEVFDRAPRSQDSAWLMPAVCVGLAILLATAVSWPIAALVRRRYGATLALNPMERRAFRLSKIAAVLILVALGVWTLVLAMMIKDNDNLTARFDWALRTAQVLGLVAFVGGFVLMLWNLWMVWSGARRWPARVWSIALVLAAFAILWTAVVFKLLTFGLNY